MVDVQALGSLGIVLALSGCASGVASFGKAEVDGGASVDAGAILTTGGVTLGVGATSTPSAVKYVEAQPGRRLLMLKLTLHNDDVADSVAASFAQFSLETDASLVLRPSTASPLTKVPCAVDTFVALGGSFACEIVFELPLGQRPSRLRYDDGRGHVGNADVPELAAPSACTLTDCWSVARRYQPKDACTDCLATTCAAEGDAASAACSGRCGCVSPSNATDPTLIAESDCSCLSGCTTNAACNTALDALMQCELACAKPCDHAKCPPP